MQLQPFMVVPAISVKASENHEIYTDVFKITVSEYVFTLTIFLRNHHCCRFLENTNQAKIANKIPLR